jgi:hypothetical protein
MRSHDDPGKERTVELLKDIARGVTWVEDYSPIERGQLQKMALDGLVIMARDRYAITDAGRAMLTSL